MEWVALVSTAFGAFVGLGASMVGEHFRWRRESRREQLTGRRLLYGQYLAALARASDGMRIAAQVSEPSSSGRQVAILEAFRTSELYALRFQLTLLAPDAVLEPAVTALRHLRQYRDTLAQGEDLEGDSAQAIHDKCFAAIRSSSDAMRVDLGVRPLTDESTALPARIRDVGL